VAIYRRSQAKFDSSGAALLLRNLGSVYSMQRRHDDAIPVLQEAMKLIKSKEGAVDVPLLADVVNILGIVHYRQNRIKKAEELFEQALDMVSALNIPFNRTHLLNNLGTVYHAKRDFKKAEGLYIEALQGIEDTMGSAHPDMIFTLCAMGVLYSDSKRYQEAEDMFRRALKLLEPRREEFGSRIARIYHALSSNYKRAGRTIEADAALAEAAVIARQGLSRHPDLVEIVEDYSATLKKQGRTKEAEELRVEARRARVKAGMVINALSPF
jgi:tetratricopeptide (TPR) repeat protein